MRTRNSIRGFVRPSVCPSVRGDRVGKCENSHFRSCPPVCNWYWPCIQPRFMYSYSLQTFYYLSEKPLSSVSNVGRPTTKVLCVDVAPQIRGAWWLSGSALAFHSEGRGFDLAGWHVLSRPGIQGAAPCPAWHGSRSLWGSGVAVWSAMLPP